MPSTSLDSDALYSVQFFALNIAKVHPITVYQSLGGLKSFPLPPCVRLGRSIRFRGSDIQNWLQNLGAQTIASKPTTSEVKRGRGRPKRAEQRQIIEVVGGGVE